MEFLENRSLIVTEPLIIKKTEKPGTNRGISSELMTLDLHRALRKIIASSFSNDQGLEIFW